MGRGSDGWGVGKGTLPTRIKAWGGARPLSEKWLEMACFGAF